MSRSADRGNRRGRYPSSPAKPASLRHEPAGAGSLTLRPGRDRSLQLRHPWIFSGAVAAVEGTPASGATVIVRGSDGVALATAAYSPASQIRARVWSFETDVAVDADWLARRLARAASARGTLFDDRHDAARLVHGESDGLPGVIVDRYGDVAVLQLLSAGAERWREALVGAVAALPRVTCVYERSDAEVRVLEGLAPRRGVAWGTLPPRIVIREDDLRYGVDPATGQKTGFYLDQRDNRRLLRELARDCRVCNAFCYSGGFTLAALAGGARDIVSIDSSADALAQGRANLELNPALPANRNTWCEVDAFAELRRLRSAGATFDLVVLDPPKFAPTAAHAARAARAYKDINLLALKLLAPGGLLMTFSCSGGVSADLFQKILAGAARDAGSDVQILRRLGAGADHPVALDFPEGDYLKGLLLRKG